MYNDYCAIISYYYLNKDYGLIKINIDKDKDKTIVYQQRGLAYD